jgi:hypothetical protein
VAEEIEEVAEVAGPAEVAETIEVAEAVVVDEVKSSAMAVAERGTSSRSARVSRTK